MGAMRPIRRMCVVTNTYRLTICWFPTQQACENMQVTCDMYRTLRGGWFHHLCTIEKQGLARINPTESVQIESGCWFSFGGVFSPSSCWQSSSLPDSLTIAHHPLSKLFFNLPIDWHIPVIRVLNPHIRLWMFAFNHMYICRLKRLLSRPVRPRAAIFNPD